jgi:hypothetical protein
MIGGYPSQPSVFPRRLAEHPAAQAWNRLSSKTAEPNFVEVLLESKRSCVYRLDGVGPSGTAVIAKKCKTPAAHVERTVYEEILPHLSIASLTFYGCVDEPATEYSWLFLEDAGDEEFVYSAEQHRRLAARWLGQMHVSAARISAVSRLPDHGPKHYLDHLRSSRRIIQRTLGDRALNSRDLQVLQAILLQSNFLESRWNRVEELSHRFPRTLVHGDFTKDHLRVRASTRGVNLVVFDWESAGHGIPAFDIAEPSGRGDTRPRVETELVDYWSVVQESWSGLDLSAIEELADLGEVFRLLAAISWDSWDIVRGCWPIKELRGHQINLAIALEHLGLTQ